MCELFLSKWVIDNFHCELAEWQLQRELADATWSEVKAWWKERGKAKRKKIYLRPSLEAT